MTYRQLTILLLFLGLAPTSGYGQAPESPAQGAPAQEKKDDIQSQLGAPKASRNPFVPQLPFTPEPEIITTETQPTTPTTPETPSTDITETPLTPTLPIPEAEKPIQGKPTLVISGILWNSERPQAIVNGNIIEVGDKMFKVSTDRGEVIDQLEFIGIDRSGVSVSFKDRTVVINSGLEPQKGAPQ